MSYIPPFLKKYVLCSAWREERLSGHEKTEYQSKNSPKICLGSQTEVDGKRYNDDHSLGDVRPHKIQKQEEGPSQAPKGIKVMNIDECRVE